MMIPVSLASIVFAFGAGSVVVLPSLAVGSFSLLFLIAILTYPAGFVVTYFLDRARSGRTLKILLGFGFITGYEMLVSHRGPIVRLVIDTPIRWYGDVLLLSVPGTSPNVVGALVAIFLPIIGFPVSVFVSARLAETVWYGTNRIPESNDESDEAEEPVAVFDRITERLPTTHTGAVIDLTWRHTVRSPYVLLYAVPAVLGVASAGYAVVTGRRAPVVLPLVAVLLGGMAAGSGFPLNPLGNDEGALPWLMTSRLEPAEYVRGKVLAASVIAAPAVTLLTVLATVPTGYTPFQTAVMGVLGFVIAASAPAIAVGIGIVAPNYERSELIRGVTTATPSRSAVLMLFGCLFVIWFPGVMGLLVPLQSEVTPMMAVFEPIAGTLVSIVLAIGTARAGYRLAIQRISRDVVDRTGGTMPTREEVVTAFALREPIQTVAVVVSVLAAALGFSVVLTTPLLVVFGREALSSFLNASLLSVVAYVATVVAYLFVSGRGRAFIGFARPERDDLLLAAGTFVVLLGIQLVANFVPVALNDSTLEPTLAAGSGPAALALVLAGALLVPPAEELLFRNLLQKRLGETFPPWSAVVVTSVVFGLFHLGTYAVSLSTVVALVTVFLEGLVLGTAYERSGNVCVPMIAHGCYNLVAFSLLVATAPT